MTTPERPLVSIIVPAYRSEQTIAASLQTILAQTYQPHEVIVVDSSPNNATEELIATQFPTITYIRSLTRLLPHVARNRGITEANGDLLVFTDPDIQAPPDWLDRLVSAYQEYPGVVAGGIACYGHRWLDVGMHLCKFDLWLPGGQTRQIEFAPTANLLCDRATFERVGPFEDNFSGDTLWCWTAAADSVPIWFAPRAKVEHYHLTSWQSFIRERFDRGKEFAQLRAERKRWPMIRVVVYAIGTLILPLGLTKVIVRVLGNAGRAGLFWEFLQVFPVVFAGQVAWLAGETVALLKILAKRIIVARPE